MNILKDEIVETGKGHFNEDDKITELPVALAAVLS